MRLSLRIIIMGVTLFVALSSFVFADPNFGPQTYQVHKYYYFGDDTYGEKSAQGLAISVDPSSVSYQSVKATVTMDWNIINDRQITKFIILANGVNVDEFEPYFDRTLSPPAYKEYYYLDVNVSDQYIGSDVYFQVVALHQDSLFNSSSNVFVVAWSQESPTIRLKPLPVTDADTHGLINVSNTWLEKIWEKLEELRSMMAQKMDQLKKAVEDIYTIKPETQAKYDAAAANFQQKLPTEQLKNQFNEMKDLMDNSANQIQNTPQKIKFGKINWMGALETDAIDFTDVMNLIESMRRILQIALWCEFLFGIIMILRPRFTV